MTIKEFAASRGASRQRVYQLIKESGKQVSDFTDGKGNITKSGLEELKKLVPDKTVPQNTDEPAETEEKQKKESEVDRLRNENRILLESVNNLSATINGLREDLSKKEEQLSEAHKIADQAQQLHRNDQLKIADLEKQLRLGAGSEPESEPEITIQIDPEGESNTPEEEPNPDTVRTEEPDPVPEKQDPKPDQPEKPEGEFSSPVTGSEQAKTEKKMSFRKRLKILFTGKEST